MDQHDPTRDNSVATYTVRFYPPAHKPSQPTAEHRPSCSWAEANSYARSTLTERAEEAEVAVICDGPTDTPLRRFVTHQGIAIQTWTALHSVHTT